MKDKEKLDIVFFDGVCNLCNQSVDFVIKNKHNELYFASLQGEMANKLLDADLTQNLESLVLYQRGQVYRFSDAALRIADYLKFPWNILFYLIIIPKFIREPIYKLIARNRYRWFGKSDTCRLPTADEKKYFLD